MLKTTFTLCKRRQFTHDVYELVYHCPDIIGEPPKPGQYVMFQLAPGLNRSYSLSHFSGEYFSLIIKRIADGRGSPIICDAPIGTTFSGMIPLGHFILQPTPSTRLFIGTGTGFAPLYAMIAHLDGGHSILHRTHFAFGVRTSADIFYRSELESLREKYPHMFSYSLHLSREDHPEMSSGYVTDLLDDPDFTHQFQEFYICGSPAMVKDAKLKLQNLGIDKDAIFSEQF